MTHDCALIVENQLEVTDHRHLGQLLTYAAGTDALTVVWIATSFRNEHTDALDYLNKISVGEAQFFGVELSVATIGDSDPAPYFKLVAKPSGWRAQVRAQREIGQMSEVRNAYYEFWRVFLDRIHLKHPGSTNVRAPQAQNWMNLNFIRRLNLVAAFSSKGEIQCQLYIDVKDELANRAIFEAFFERREEIESAVGHPLRWEPLENRRACRITSATPGQVVSSDSSQLLQWLEGEFLTFRRVLIPIIKSLPDNLWFTSETVDDL